MKDIVLLGAGGFAREVCFLLEDNNAVCPEWNILGFLTPDTSTDQIGRYPVFHDNRILLDRQEISAVCCIGSSEARKRVVAPFLHTHVRFPNIISRRAVLSDSVHLGQGNIICASTIMTVDVTVGDFLLCNLDCSIGHDVRIGDYVTLYPKACISGAVTIGSRVEVGTCGAVIQGLAIGDGAILGAGAVAVRDVEANVTAVGVPAQVIKRRGAVQETTHG
ncbi:MAG: acetyltransferase [Oscillibacter sp.]|nr:acetyltransferase [Oscillibacter sp.]